MDLTLDDDQRLLAESARQLCERTYPTTEARKVEELPERYSVDLWARAGELGWPGIALPEACGGAGYGVLELAILAEELGRGAVTLPLLSSFAATLPVLWAGSDATRARWLDRLAGGDALGALGAARARRGLGAHRARGRRHRGGGGVDPLGHEGRSDVRRRGRRAARQCRPRRRGGVAGRDLRRRARRHAHRGTRRSRPSRSPR